MSEYRERIAKALYAAMPLVSELPRGPAHQERVCADRLAPLVEAAIEAAIMGIIGGNRTDPVMEMHASESWAAALSVLEGKEKQ